VEITRSGTGKHTALRVKGKLDAYWSDALSTELEACVRGGATEVSLNLSGVSFISSAGLSVLLIYLKQMKAINGALRIVDPSEKVRSIFDLSGLTELLLQSQDDAGLLRDEPMKKLEDGSGSFCAYPIDGEARGRLAYYAPPLGRQGAYPLISLPSTHFGFGIGAFGDVGSGVEQQFGEFLSASGITICLPTDDRNHPDYMIEDGVFVPSISVYSGMVAEAAFTTALRFEASEQRRGMPLSRLARLALDAAGRSVAVLMIAETAALIGSSLRRSPVPDGFAWTFPELRDQFAFTTEPSFPKTIALVCAVFSAEKAPYLRRLSPGKDVFGHAHAAVFSYRPMPAGKVEPQSFIRALFDEESIHTVLHLLYDDRTMLSSIESEFVRGAMFLHPLEGVPRHEAQDPDSDVPAEGGGDT
jgi:anti-anti-sigma factor